MKYGKLFDFIIVIVDIAKKKKIEDLYAMIIMVGIQYMSENVSRRRGYGKMRQLKNKVESWVRTVNDWD